MQSLKQRVYLNRVVSGLGDWMTLLATALWISDKFGAHWVPYAFLISSLPHLLLSRWVASRVESRRLGRLYGVAQVALAVNVASLTFGQPSLLRFFIYLGVAATLGAFARPAWDTLLGSWFADSERKEVFTRTGAITSALLVLAPMSGGALSQFAGYRAVFLVDALSFLLGLVLITPELLSWHPRSPKTAVGAQRSLDGHREQSTATSPVVERALPPQLRTAILAWYGLLVLGVLINGTEYVAFQRSGYSAAQVGLITGSWGVGGLLSFLFSKRLAHERFSNLSPLLLGTALAAFLLTQRAQVSCALFVMSGFLNAHLGGSLRAEIQQRMHPAIPSVRVWALLNQRLSIINILGYVVCGLLLSKAPLFWTSAALGFVAVGSFLIRRSEL